MAKHGEIGFCLESLVGLDCATGYPFNNRWHQHVYDAGGAVCGAGRRDRIDVDAAADDFGVAILTSNGAAWCQGSCLLRWWDAELISDDSGAGMALILGSTGL